MHVMFGLSVLMSLVPQSNLFTGTEVARLKVKIYRGRQVQIYEECRAGAARCDFGVLKPGLLNVGMEASSGRDREVQPSVGTCMINALNIFTLRCSPYADHSPVLDSD
ncbi:hypothetical protein EV401DRAFT_7555 [Pisolithus croceorrhizus]|nr:hypothetical protein EV401DRAFT_7555 [Pisolithus croceorrhizus]